MTITKLLFSRLMLPLKLPFAHTPAIVAAGALPVDRAL